MLAPELKTIHSLRYARNVPGRNPPKREVRFDGRLEPSRTITKRSKVPAGIRKLFQRLDGIPNRKIEQNVQVILGANRCAVSLGSFQSPDEARAAIGERVHLGQLCDGPGHHRGIEWREHARDVHLCQMVVER